jgi:2-hydroxycyclohexanecarboxyl-CoA dehydrogenase
VELDRTTVAFVTGAGRGIGAAIAERLRAEGATVVEHGRLDLAVACADIGVAGLASELDDEWWDRSIAVNLTGTINTIRAAYEVMLTRGRGHLVAVASLSGLLPTPLLVPYATSKGGVVSFMTSLRPEAARGRRGSDDDLPRAGRHRTP